MEKNVNELKEFVLNKELFDDLSKEDYFALKQDIEKNGIKTELHITNENIVLCGHQRLKIAKELKLNTVPIKFVNPIDCEEYVIKDNLLRRQLDDTQKGELFLRLGEKYVGRLGINQYEKEGSDKLSLPSGKTSELVAKEVYGTKSKARSIERAIKYAKIVRERPEFKGKPISVVLKKDKINKAISERASKNDDKVIKNLICGDALENVKKLANASIDLVIIDPPYNIGFKSVRGANTTDFSDSIDWDYLTKLFDEIWRVLKENSHFYCFCGFQTIDRFKSIIEKIFNFRNIIIWVKNNHTPTDYAYNYAHTYEMIIFASKGKRPLNTNNIVLNDVIFCDNIHGKQHSAEKPIDLLKLLINNSSLPNEIILDCFAGSGSTLLASKKLGRSWIGIELDPKWIDLIRNNLRGDEIGE